MIKTVITFIWIIENLFGTMATFNVAPPENFDFMNPVEFDKWLTRFERFKLASGLNEKSEETQVNTLVYCMGKQADDVFQSFSLSVDQMKNYNTVKNKFKSHFVIRKNTIFERAKFNSRRQEDDESADSFITALYTLSEHCKYAGLREELIRDRLVVGIRDEKLSQKLQLDPDLTLEKAINMVRQNEAVRQQQAIIRGSSEQGIDAVRSSRNSGFSRRRQRGGKRSQIQTQSSRCGRCGATPGHNRASCPAAESLCHGCKQKGHWLRMCRNEQTDVSCINALVHNDNDSDSYEDDNYYLGCIDEGSSRPWYVELQVRFKCIRFKIDTGADVTCIPENVYVDLGKPALSKSTKKLYGPGEKELCVLGKFTDTLTRGNQSVSDEIFVVRGLQRCLLGRPAIVKFDFVKLNSLDEVFTHETVKQAHPGLFKEIGSLAGEYKIALKDEISPFALSVPRRVAIPLLPRVKQELERMESQGIISRVEAPTDWCSGMVVVPKADGNVRICVDFTKLNENVKRENFPMPVIDQTLGMLAGAKYFTKLDANSSFWQIPLADESKPLTCFITPFGRYVFNRLPYGLCSASEFFQRRMSQILDGILGVMCHTDDILVFGTTEIEHDERLENVLSKLEAANLTLNPSKYEYKQPKVKFVGHVIGPEGVSADPDRVEAVKTMQPPTDIHGVRRLMGMVNQLGKFSSLLSEVSTPIRELLSKKNHFVWGKAQQGAFEKIKTLLTSSEILALYDPNKETIVAADSSRNALGVAVFQVQENGHKSQSLMLHVR